MVICLEQGADLHMAQLMPVPLAVSCFSKIQTGLPFWYRLTWVVSDKGPLNGCVSVPSVLWLGFRENIHTPVYIHPFNGPLSKTTRVSRYQKGKTNLDFTEARDMGGSGISWAICKSAPHSRQITTPAPHHSVFTGRMPFLPPNQQRQSTEGKTSGL